MTVCVLTIAGSDPCGGAGVQADLRAFGALGVAGLSAITALTVQNSQGVTAVHPVEAEVLAAQIAAVLSDSPVGAVKIGMLGGAAQVEAVAGALQQFRPPHLVLDPVLASTGGVPLLDENGIAALLEKLLPLCELVTPNLEECRRLTGLQVAGPDAAREAALRLRSLGAGSVLIKGGHLPQAPSDLLLDADGAFHLLAGERVDTPHTHGTGCLLSAAIAAELARGRPLLEAATSAKQLVSLALQHPVVIGRGRGYPDPGSAWERRHPAGTDPRRQDAGAPRSHADRLALLQGLYVLTAPELRPDRDALAVAHAALAGGAKIIQLRDKGSSTPALVEMARQLNALAREHHALFIVNDRVEVALAAQADGVHLGPDDLPPADARRLLGPDAIIGVSVSDVAEARAAAPYASYLGVGAIFGSTTKSDAGPPVGVERIAQIKAAFPNHPIVAIGGISQDNIGAVARAGAAAAAVISAVVCAPDMQAAVETLGRSFREP